MKTKISSLFLLLTIVSFSAVNAQLVILSGPEQASYHRFIDDINNALGSDEGNPFINKSTNGAEYNYNQLIDPKSPYKVAMMQSDLLYFKQALDMRDNTSKTKDIKVILPLANEEIHIVTKATSGLTKLQDLDSSLVAIGTKEQGTYATAQLIKDKTKVYWSSRNIHFDQALKDLALDEIDAFFIIGTAPIEKLNLDPRILRTEPALLELTDFNGWAKYYDNDTIYTEDYKWLEKDIPTFSIKTVLIVNEAKLTEADRKDITRLVNSIKNNFDRLKKIGHPKWKEVDLSDWTDTEWPMYK